MAEKGKEEKITEKPESEKDKEFKDPNLPEEGTKDAAEGKSDPPKDEKEEEEESKAEEAEPPAPQRESVRGEDVLKILRAKGHKI